MLQHSQKNTCAKAIYEIYIIAFHHRTSKENLKNLVMMFRNASDKTK